MKKFLMKFMILAFIVIICIALLNMCGAENEAKRLLKDKGYKIVSSEGIVSEYTVEKNILNTPGGKKVWQIQKVNVPDYIGKKIENYMFIVKNHPLDNKSHSDKKQTRVYVKTCNGKVIGGSSIPYAEGLLVGVTVYTLDGKEFGK